MSDPIDLMNQINALRQQIEWMKTIIPGGYTSIPRTTLTDTGSVLWDGTPNKAAGTYTFDLQAGANNLPDFITALHVYLSASWAAAADTSFMTLGPRGGGSGAFVGNIRALVNNIRSDAQIIVPVDSTNFDIEAIVSGATANGCILRAIGYFF